MASDPTHPDLDPAAPPALIDALKAAHAPPETIPGYVDNLILMRAREEVRQRATSRRSIHRWQQLAAAAAAVALFVWIGNRVQTRPTKLIPQAKAPVRDVNVDGRIDIIDAFSLAKVVDARAAEGNPALSPVERQWDMNGDGMLDAADIDDVAAWAVSLVKNPPSVQGGAG